MKYSVIVPFHSNINFLTACVKALTLSLDPSDSEIIIVDNNAVASQLDDAIRKDSRFTVISKHENLMYPKAVNLGAAHAKGEYLIFCDTDTFVLPGFHIPLTDALNDLEVGYASAKLLNIQTNDVQEFGITSSYYNYPHPYAGRPQDYELVSRNHWPLAACAACSAIKKELFIDLGGFDEELIHSYSDIDFCLRLAARGYKTVCVAASKAYHCGASTIGSGMSRSLKEDTKGLFSAKHPKVPVQIEKYLNASCDFFSNRVKLHHGDYFVLDCSTIGNSDLYIDFVMDRLELRETLRLKLPYSQRDAVCVDYLNFVPFNIRNYRVPILYFVDSFLSFRENGLWRSCRADYEDIVLDRNANIELLQRI